MFRLALLASCLWLAGCKSADRFTFVDDLDAERLLVQLDGAPFATLRHHGLPNPALFPLLAPGGVRVSRRLPEEPGAEPIADHPHHRSLWFAHGALNGEDFWAGNGRIDVLHVDAEPGSSGKVQLTCAWRGGVDHAVTIADEVRTLRCRAGLGFHAIDVDSTLRGHGGPLRFGDTKEGLMAVRLRQELCLVGKGASGHILTSEGRRDAEAWGKRARWVLYTAVVEGVPVAVAMFDHPQNHGHPTTWHARDYGLLAANPFGLHDFTGSKAGTGDLTVPAGQALRLRYSVWIARGEVTAATVEAAYAAWLAVAD